MGGQFPAQTPPPEPKHYEKPLEIGEAGEGAKPKYNRPTIIPPEGVTDKELFTFPGVNWLEFFRDSVVDVAHSRLHEAYDIVANMKNVEPGNFEQADSIRTYVTNVRNDTRQNLELLGGVLSNLMVTLSEQAVKYKRLFQRAGSQLQQSKPLSQNMADPGK